MTLGVIRLIVIGAVTFFVMFFLLELREKDSTDPSYGRSGLRLYTDAQTGCQYVSPGLFGGITPRMNGSWRANL